MGRDRVPERLALPAQPDSLGTPLVGLHADLVVRRGPRVVLPQAPDALPDLPQALGSVRFVTILPSKDLEPPQAIEISVSELISVAPQAAIATRVAPAIALHARSRSTEYVGEDPFAFQLRHEPGTTRHVVVKHNRRFSRPIAACNGDVQIGVRNFQRVRRAQQDRVGHRVRIPLLVDHRKLKAHNIGGQFVTERAAL